MEPELRLYEDVLSNRGELPLPAVPRMIFVVHGSVAAADHALRDGETLSGEGAVTLKAASGGATLWRWEFGSGDARAAEGRGAVTREKLKARLETLPQGALLLR